ARIDGPRAQEAQRAAHRQHASFPAMMKDRLVGLGLDLTKPVHPAHIVDAVHHATSLGFFGRPAPIMQSRVIRLASCASLQPSVSAGRLGTTRDGVSAVESQTRISVSGGKVTPKCASTVRGSLTVRER